MALACLMSLTSLAALALDDADPGLEMALQRSFYNKRALPAHAQNFMALAKIDTDTLEGLPGHGLRMAAVVRLSRST